MALAAVAGAGLSVFQRKLERSHIHSAGWRCAVLVRLKRDHSGVRRHSTPIARRAGRALAIAALALIAAASPAAALGGAREIAHQRSANWAGYAVTAATPVTAVSAWWVQPAAQCDQPYPTYSGFWVGLGGFKASSKAIEQVGTEADCTIRGAQQQYAWYELLPAPPVRVKLPVSAGDLLIAGVTVQGQHVTLRIRNATTGHAFVKTVKDSSPDTSSAEWIAEAPSACLNANQCETLPLADFGSVRFTHARGRTAGGHVGTISDPRFAITKVSLSTAGAGIGPGLTGAADVASPSVLSHHGGTFTVGFVQGAQVASAARAAAPDLLRHARRTQSIPEFDGT